MINSKINKYLEILSNKNVMVLATTSQNKVTARNISVILIDTSIFFQTDQRMDKATQIELNENVALCIDNFQIIGKAKKIGKWENHADLKNKYCKIHNESYLNYGNLDFEIVYEVRITEIKIWEYRNGIPIIIYINIENNEIIEEEYAI